MYIRIFRYWHLATMVVKRVNDDINYIGRYSIYYIIIWYYMAYAIPIYNFLVSGILRYCSTCTWLHILWMSIIYIICILAYTL